MSSISEDLLNCNRETTELIGKIVRRLRDTFPQPSFDALSLSMDLTVCHNRGHVDLVALEGARISDFLHDIAGIGKHLDRETGELTDCFLPRCREVGAA